MVLAKHTPGLNIRTPSASTSRTPASTQRVCHARVHLTIHLRTRVNLNLTACSSQAETRQHRRVADELKVQKPVVDFSKWLAPRKSKQRQAYAWCNTLQERSCAGAAAARRQQGSPFPAAGEGVRRQKSMSQPPKTWATTTEYTARHSPMHTTVKLFATAQAHNPQTHLRTSQRAPHKHILVHAWGHMALLQWLNSI